MLVLLALVRSVCLVYLCVCICARAGQPGQTGQAGWRAGRLADRPWGEDVLSLGRWTCRRQAHRPADVIVLSRLPACLLRCGQRDGCTPKAEGAAAAAAAAALGGGESTYVSRWRANGSSRLSNGRRQTAVLPEGASRQCTSYLSTSTSAHARAQSAPSQHKPRSRQSSSSSSSLLSPSPSPSPGRLVRARARVRG